MRDDKKAIEQLEGHCRHGEEVEGDDHLPVIVEKGEPPLVGIATAMDSSQITSHAAFGECEAELLQFASFDGAVPETVEEEEPNVDEDTVAAVESTDEAED